MKSKISRVRWHNTKSYPISNYVSHADQNRIATMSQTKFSKNLFERKCIVICIIVAFVPKHFVKKGYYLIKHLVGGAVSHCQMVSLDDNEIY